MYQFHRIFLATPWEMEGERRRFYDLAGAFNEAYAMRRRLLFTPVTIVNIRDKRPYQYTIEENIRDSSAYIQLLQEGWGPVERNFENDYLMARRFAADPAVPMRRVSLIRKILPSDRPLEPGLPAPQSEFASMEEFDRCIQAELSQLLEALTNGSETGIHATA
jgi:hypothetical protein